MDEYVNKINVPKQNILILVINNNLTKYNAWYKTKVCVLISKTHIKFISRKTGKYVEMVWKVVLIQCFIYFIKYNLW
jgi:hypothetical protein